jgi:hypothetical protein
MKATHLHVFTMTDGYDMNILDPEFGDQKLFLRKIGCVGRFCKCFNRFL